MGNAVSEIQERLAGPNPEISWASYVRCCGPAAHELPLLAFKNVFKNRVFHWQGTIARLGKPEATSLLRTNHYTIRMNPTESLMGMNSDINLIVPKALRGMVRGWYVGCQVSFCARMVSQGGKLTNHVMELVNFVSPSELAPQRWEDYLYNCGWAAQSMPEFRFNKWFRGKIFMLPVKVLSCRQRALSSIFDIRVMKDGITLTLTCQGESLKRAPVHVVPGAEIAFIGRWVGVHHLEVIDFLRENDTPTIAGVDYVESVLRIRQSTPAGGAPPPAFAPFQQQASPRRAEDGAKLFIGGLAWGTTDDTLRTAFEAYGKVIEARVMADRETGRSRGFGFVTYENDAAAMRAMEQMNDKELDGRRIRVDRAQDRAPGGPRPVTLMASAPLGARSAPMYMLPSAAFTPVYQEPTAPPPPPTGGYPAATATVPAPAPAPGPSVPATATATATSGSYAPPTASSSAPAGQCTICLDQPATVVFVPCGHLCCCPDCSEMIMAKNRQCPICRADISTSVRTFFSGAPADEPMPCGTPSACDKSPSEKPEKPEKPEKDEPEKPEKPEKRKKEDCIIS
ncbi:putative RNA-binding protein [Paratrimastix pyriformis]|uniref:RNA-binding protein n=1 Tax=Paratrimastix pyriformis TaxID=342808 RepID=A0ABQ8UN51_9EUKA|nr:putative RNA-binding protein [Paratrimastix pyriformis]